MWQQLLRSGAAADATKAGAVEALVKLLAAQAGGQQGGASGDSQGVTAALGALSCLCQQQAGRDALLGARPAALPLVLAAASGCGSASEFNAAAGGHSAALAGPECRCRAVMMAPRALMHAAAGRGSLPVCGCLTQRPCAPLQPCCWCCCARPTAAPGLSRRSRRRAT